MKLIIPFEDKSKSFTCGIEAGRILARMERGESVVDNNGFPIHSCNKNVIQSMCRHYGYMPSFGNSEYVDEHGIIQRAEGWIEFKAVKHMHSNN